jgi:dethiobiotin synthase
VSLFVVGTDTGVGKTVVAAALLARYRERLPLVYWKPIATGASEDRDRDSVAALVPGIPSAAEAYLFADPVSPHLASRREGVPIELARIAARWRELRATFAGSGFVVEGAGGVLVPLDEEGTLLADLVAAMALPAVVVARSTLGTINHTLLTLEALRSRVVEVAGVVLDGPPDADNREAIERFGSVEVLGELPPIPDLGPATLTAAARALDPLSLLLPWLDPEVRDGSARSRA